MFVEISFKVEPASVPDLKYKLEINHLPEDITSLLKKGNEITVIEDTPSADYEYLYWKVALAKWPTNGSTLAAALRLVWRVYKLTTQYAVEIVGVHVYR